MEGQIAVQCDTQKEWEAVRLKAGLALNFPLPKDDTVSITIGGSCAGGWGSVKYNESIGYKTISAADYLKEGEIDMQGSLVTGDIYTLSHIGNPFISVEEIKGGNNTYSKERFKLVGKQDKPKTTKENNMNINSSIRTVFAEEDKAPFDLVEKMQNVFGGEIKEDFTGAMILRNNKEEYLAEIKRLDDIEAKRLKEEAKK